MASMEPNVSVLRSEATTLCAEIWDFARKCEHMVLGVSPADLDECVGATPSVVIHGARDSGKTTLLNVLAHDIVAPHRVRGRAEIRNNGGVTRVDVLLVRGMAEKHNISYEVPLDGDAVARSVASRGSLGSLPQGWEDSNAIMWYPIRDDSAVKGCAIVEDHNNNLTQRLNELSVLVLRDSTVTEVPPGLEAWDPDRLFVVVNRPKNTDDRERIAALCSAKLEHVFFVDCARAIADVVLPSAAGECFTPSQFGGELPRLERYLRTAAQTLHHSGAASTVCDGVENIVAALGAHIDVLRKRKEDLEGLIDSVRRAPTSRRASRCDLQVTGERESGKDFAVKVAGNEGTPHIPLPVLLENDAWVGLKYETTAGAKDGSTAEVWNPKPSGWRVKEKGEQWIPKGMWDPGAEAVEEDCAWPSRTEWRPRPSEWVAKQYAPDKK